MQNGLSLEDLGYLYFRKPPIKVYPRTSRGQTFIDVQSPWFLYGNGLQMVGFSTSILAYGFQGDFTGPDLSSTSEIGVYKL